MANKHHKKLPVNVDLKVLETRLWCKCLWTDGQIDEEKNGRMIILLYGLYNSHN